MSEITKTSRSFWVILPWQTKTSLLFSSKMGVLPRENARHRHGRRWEIHGIREGTPVAHLLDLKGFAANKEAPWPGAKKPSWNISRSVLINLISFDVSLCYGITARHGMLFPDLSRYIRQSSFMSGPMTNLPTPPDACWTRRPLCRHRPRCDSPRHPARWRCPPGLMGFMNGINEWDISGILVE